MYSKNVPTNTKMKNHILFLFLFTAISLSSCEKIENIKTLGDIASGEYKGIAIVLGGTEIPLPLENGDNSLNINFIISKSTELTADFRIVFEEKTNGIMKTEYEDHKGLTLTRNPNGSISLVENDKELAVVNGQNLEMTVVIEELTSTFKGLKK